MQPTTQKKKYVMEEFISANRANPIINSYSQQKCCLACICNNKDSNGQTCFKCNIFVHACLASKPNRNDRYECCSCLNKALDPLFQVRKILAESFFKTFSIFEYINIFNFQFTLSHEDLGFPVQVRGLFPDTTALSWPMQGAFYVNDEKNAVYELKPLLYNSNRKHRREEYFSIPSDRLKLGKNFVRFKIPCLDRAKFTAKYQHEDKKVYYMAVNSVQRLSQADLESQTFRQRRVEKNESLKILKSNNADIQVTQNKVCLICPYTKERIKVPVRGRYCKHFSCICLLTLIVSHAASRHWGCPICELKMNEPYVDVWIYNMLKDNQQGSDVIVKQDGSYEWFKVKEIAMMSLQSDDQDTPPARPPPKTQSNLKLQSNQKKEVQKEEKKEKKEVKQSKAKEPDPPKKASVPQQNVISLDDDDQEEIARNRKQEEVKKLMISKLKQKLKVSKVDSQQSKSVEKPIESKKNKDVQESEAKKSDQSISISKPRPPPLAQIKVLQCKEMKHEEFKKSFFKSKINPYRKYINSQELKRLFKDIL